MEFTPVTDQYTAAPPSMGQYSPDSVTDDTAKLIDQREYQPANPIAAQPSPPVYTHPLQQPQAASNVSVVAVSHQPTTNIVTVPDRPSNYLALSLLNLICCCFPLGIAALIYSTRVDSEYNEGHYEGARSASNTARTLNIVGITIGSILYAMLIIFVIYIVIATAVTASE